jgi:hypothetical protein
MTASTRAPRKEDVIPPHLERLFLKTLIIKFFTYLLALLSYCTMTIANSRRARRGCEEEDGQGAPFFILSISSAKIAFIQRLPFIQRLQCRPLSAVSFTPL